MLLQMTLFHSFKKKNFLAMPRVACGILALLKESEKVAQLCPALCYPVDLEYSRPEYWSG